MSSYWANFVATGDPNGTGLPPWPRTTGKSPVVFEVGDRFGLMPVADSEKLNFFRRYYAMRSFAQ
jgi:carboxylesterase type B